MGENSSVALIPGAGMGHLSPFVTLAATLSRHGFAVVLITTNTTISNAESDLLTRLLSSFPSIKCLRYDPLALNSDPSISKTTDPFFVQYEAIRRSSDAIRPLLQNLQSTTNLSAIVSDVALISCTCDVVSELEIPNYVLFPSSATMLAFNAHFAKADPPSGNSDDLTGEDVKLPGIGQFPSFCYPPIFKIPTHIFTIHVLKNSQALARADGVLINTFYELESRSIDALNDGKIVPTMPKLFPIGPFLGLHSIDGSISDEDNLGHRENEYKIWLNEQENKSVLYVSFGSRHALSPEQIKELAYGLEKSEYKFLWVIKTKIVDKEESRNGVAGLGENVLPEGFSEKVKGRGLIVNQWVDQPFILGHSSVGGFVSHCGWNSVSEAVWHGVPVFAWPQFGDQMFNATVVEGGGGGAWERSWRGDGGLVKGEEIARRLKAWMAADNAVRNRAERAKEKAREAVAPGGGSNRTLIELFDTWRPVSSLNSLK